MSYRPFAACVVLLISAISFGDPGQITIQVNSPTAPIGPLTFGLMTEEINHSYDGGLYAELIQNRNFRSDDQEPIHWSVVKSDGAAATIALDETDPVNHTGLPRSLRLDITQAGEGKRAGIANDGYWGIPVRADTKYKASFYARASEGFSGPLTVSIESNDGATTFASATVAGITTAWKKFEVSLTTGKTEPSITNRFVITASEKGSVWFSLVSLFPPTFNDRPNGMRPDLMQLLADLHPGFLRFPGGAYVEGTVIANRFDWKKTIGPLEDRPGHPSMWGYRSTDGVGLMEFLLWCQDLHMQPVLAVYAGFSTRGEHVEAGPKLQPFVQDALDEIEYVIGDANTTWGRRRIADGHPEPFKLDFVEIGNEDYWDRSRTYEGRFAQFYDAIKLKYPQLKVIATMGVRTRRPDITDQHFYAQPAEMLLHQWRMYDKYDRKGIPVMVGEWATSLGKPTATLYAALCDAAFLTGVERNADIVGLTCYAPLFVNVNKEEIWPTNLIGFDAMTSFGSPSYYVQRMISTSHGDFTLPVELTARDPRSTNSDSQAGAVGVGTWNTSAEYKDLKVTRGDKILYQSDFASGKSDLKPREGDWGIKDGALLQKDDSHEDCRATVGDPSWADYTLSVKARKISGQEGFLVMFDVKGINDYLWWNIGGWNNTQAGIQQASAGAKQPVGKFGPLVIETGRWYDIRIETKGSEIKCFLDDKLITQATAIPAPALYAVASRVTAGGEVILHVVNPLPVPQQIQITLAGAKEVAGHAAVEVLTGSPTDVNTVREPRKLFPEQSTIDNAGSQFTHEFPASSFTVLRLNVK